MQQTKFPWNVPLRKIVNRITNFGKENLLVNISLGAPKSAKQVPPQQQHILIFKQKSNTSCIKKRQPLKKSDHWFFRKDYETQKKFPLVLPEL